MLGSLLTASLRLLWKDRLYTGINLIGLTVAFAASILIGLYIRNELSYENFVVDSDRVDAVVHEFTIGDQPTSPFLATPVALKRELDAVLGDRAHVARGFAARAPLGSGEQRTTELAYYADPAFFRIMTLPFRRGDPAHALDAPDSIVLTESAARKYFGDADPMGRTIEVEGKATARVTGILADPPSNTRFDAVAYLAALGPTSPIVEMERVSGWHDMNVNLWIRRAPGTSTAEIQAALDRIDADQYRDETDARHRDYLVPLHTAHLSPWIRQTGSTGDPVTLTALGLTALLLLAIAAINFTNLATARAARRTKEIGVRKALGATRGVLVLQLVSEPVMIAGAALLLAVSIAELVLPAYQNFLGKPISFPYWRDPLLVAGLVLPALISGALAGLYPALFLSKLKPGPALKGTGSTGTGMSARLRQVLVVSQFAVSIGLVIATSFIQRQTMHAREANAGFSDSDLLVVVGSMGQIRDPDVKERLRERLVESRVLATASGSTLVPTDPVQSIGARDDIVPGVRVVYSLVRVDERFFETYGIRLLAGRTFDRAHPADLIGQGKEATGGEMPVVINEQAARLFGFAQPADAVGRVVGNSGDDQRPWQIIGVVPDFRLHSVRDPNMATVFLFQPSWFRNITVKLRPGAIREGIVELDRIWRETVPGIPIRRSFLDETVARYYGDLEREAQSFAFFGAMAVLLGCLGLFGLAAYTAVRRTKEIGVRKAMGATTHDVVRLLVLQLTQPVLIANLIAWPVAFLLVRNWLGRFADRIPIDLWPFAAVGAGALLLAWATVIGHAIAVARARPVTALRYE